MQGFMRDFDPRPWAYFAVFGMIVAAFVALGLIAGLGYILYLGVAALLA